VFVGGSRRERTRVTRRNRRRREQEEVGLMMEGAKYKHLFMRAVYISTYQETADHTKRFEFNWPGAKATAYSCHPQGCTSFTGQKAKAEEIQQGEETQASIRKMEKKVYKYI
jgi:hypothetical protein